MNKEIITSFLIQNGLSEIEEINSKDDVFAVRFYYNFDENELAAAKAYADDECVEDDIVDDKLDTWNKEFFIPYLNELAVDNVGDIIEDAIEEFTIDAQFVSYDIDETDYEFNEFVAIFYKKDLDIKIEDVLDNLEL
jgi:hypothetical protein